LNSHLKSTEDTQEPAVTRENARRIWVAIAMFSPWTTIALFSGSRYQSKGEKASFEPGLEGPA
jgi:hypothetical protein